MEKRSSTRVISAFTLLISFATLQHATIAQTHTFYYDTDEYAAIQAVNAILSTSGITGDHIFEFESGEIFRGTISIPNQNQATFKFRSTGMDKAIIKGSRKATGSWSLYSTGNSTDIYSTSIVLPGTSPKILHVYKDGVLLTQARYPNKLGDEPDAAEWLFNQNNETFNQLEIADWTANQLNFNVEPGDGTEAVVRTSNWLYERKNVTGFNAVDGILTFADLETALGVYHWGFFLTNNIALLDSPNEWFATETELFIGVPTGGAAPSNIEFVIKQEASNEDHLNHGIWNSQSNAVEIENLHLTHYSKAAIGSLNCSNLIIDGCLIDHSTHGIAADFTAPATNHKYRNNRFKDIYSLVISGSLISNAHIHDNHLTRCGKIPGLGTNDFAAYYGLRWSGNGTKIYNNVLHDIGSGGIAMGSTTSDSKIYNNIVSEANALLNDAGGITFDMCQNLEIYDNVVKDLRKNWEQRRVSAADDYHSADDISYGIYFGHQQIENVLVANNNIHNCAVGIHVDHSGLSGGHMIIGNTLFNNGTQLTMTDYSNHRCFEDLNGNWHQLGDPEHCDGAYQQGQGGPNYLASYNDTYSNNILYSLNSDQSSILQRNVWAAEHSGSFGLVDFGTFDNNYYFNPFNDIILLREVKYSIPTCGPNVPSFKAFTNLVPDRIIPYTLNSWQASSNDNDDANSTASPLQLKDYMMDLTDPPTIILSDQITTGSLAQWYVGEEECALLTGSEYSIIQEGPVEALRAVQCDHINRWGVGTIALNEAGIYEFSFKLRSTDTPVLRLGPIHNGSYMPGKFVSTGSDWSSGSRTLLFELDPTMGSLLAAFQNPLRGLGLPDYQNSTVDLDDFLVRKVEIVPNFFETDIEPNHILRYHCPLIPISDENIGDQPYTLDGCWSDVTGELYSGDIFLDPWESIVLFRIEPTYFIDVAEHHIPWGAQETWDSDRNIRGSIIVENGGQLIINNGAVIGFADSRQDDEILTNIVVETGGYLSITDGAILTTIPGCGNRSMWDGIKVLGEDPDHPGEVFVGNATIENALTGILSGEGDPETPGVVSSVHGGKVTTDGATFLNNKHDIVFLDFPGPGPQQGYALSYLQLSEFKTTAPLQYDGVDPVVHVRIAEDANPLGINSCLFANDLPSHTESNRMGNGIEAFNGSFGIIQNGLGQFSEFRNLDHAVHGMYSTGGLNAGVRNARFHNNICAVYLSGATNVQIRDNEVEVGKWWGVLMEGEEDAIMEPFHRGIFTTGSWGLLIQDNNLYRSSAAPGGALLEGIVVGYTNDNNEVVYRNTASNLDLGFVGEGISADVLGGNPNSIGLQFQCNTNANNVTNLMSRKAENAPLLEQDDHTIRGIQGNPDLAAGNKFDQDTDWDFDKNTTQVPIITYYFDPAFADQEPNNHPTDVQPLAITGSGNACSDGPGGMLPGGGGNITVTTVKPILNTSKYEYGTLRYQYEQLIDGGNTDEVVQEIINTWPQEIWDLRDYLLARSPYLSVESLKELINKQSVPEAIKLEICVANPEATQRDGFLRWAEYESYYPLPAYAISTIRASWDQRTYRFALEAQMGAKHTRMTQAVNHLLELYVADSTRNNADSLRWVWQQLRTNAARYAETGLLMSQWRYDDALAVLNAMPAERDPRAPEEQERQRMLAYVNLLAAAATDGRSIYALNTQEVNGLKQLVEDRYDRPAVWASNLLCTHYRICRQPYTGGQPTPKTLSLSQPDAAATGPASALSIHPNPASNWAAFSYTIPGNSANLQLRIRNAQGSMIHTLQGTGEVGQLMWDTRGIAPGVYSVELLRDGKMERTERLIIQP